MIEFILNNWYYYFAINCKMQLEKYKNIQFLNLFVKKL